ncbi:MAG: FAD-dependent oxidoreductase [Eubacteriales bacterium]|nr:FAD-dependent oxidoreductase [Eubacteriales bacterium]
MRLIVIGAVAAGTSAAAKARRNSEELEIVIYEKDTYISYSGCGMPYFIGGVIDDSEELTPRDPEFFRKKYNININTRHEVTDIFPDTKTVRVRRLADGHVFDDRYDKLIIATGAKASRPPIPGTEGDNAFVLRNINDMYRIYGYIRENKPVEAIIYGSGFIGLEMCEALHELDMKITLIEKLPQIVPALDPDMSAHVEAYLREKSVTVIKGQEAEYVPEYDADLPPLIILATGVRPEVSLAVKAGVELGSTGAIKVDAGMRTNIEEVYACGDCIEHCMIVDGSSIYRPLGSTANKTGRIAGDCATGGDVEFRGILGTGIFRIFDMTVAQTGLTEKDAKVRGLDIVICHNIKPDKPKYMGGEDMVIKAVADKHDGRLLGVQIVGYNGVDKRIDVFVTAISFGAKASDLFHLDLAYAPPFSTTKDPVMYTGMILESILGKYSG